MRILAYGRTEDIPDVWITTQLNFPLLGVLGPPRRDGSANRDLVRLKGVGKQLGFSVAGFAGKLAMYASVFAAARTFL